MLLRQLLFRAHSDIEVDAWVMAWGTRQAVQILAMGSKQARLS